MRGNFNPQIARKQGVHAPFKPCAPNHNKRIINTGGAIMHLYHKEPVEVETTVSYKMSNEAVKNLLNSPIYLALEKHLNSYNDLLKSETLNLDLNQEAK